MARKVCILGASPDSDNKGVAALAASLVQLLSPDGKSKEISIFASSRISGEVNIPGPNGDIRVMVYNYRLNLRAGFARSLPLVLLASLFYRVFPSKAIRSKLQTISPPLKVLTESDLIGDIRGGDSFSDIYGIKRFVISLIPLFTAMMLGKKFILFPQTYGPYKARFARSIARHIMKHAEMIMTRDTAGIDVIEGLTKVPKLSSRIRFCPDVAFGLSIREPDTLEYKEIRRIHEQLSPPLVGVNISGLLYSGGYSRDNMFDLKMDYRVFSHKLLVNLLEETDACICLVPHTYGEKGTVNSDPDACEQLYRKLEQYGDRIKLISGIYNQSEIKALIGQMDFFIGARMHSCIASLSQGIPTVGIAYSRKFVGVFETLKQSEMIVDARTCDEESGVDLVLKSYKARKDIRRQLAPEAERVRDLVAENFKSIREKYLNG